MVFVQRTKLSSGMTTLNCPNKDCSNSYEILTTNLSLLRVSGADICEKCFTRMLEPNIILTSGINVYSCISCGEKIKSVKTIFFCKCGGFLKEIKKAVI